MDILDCNSWSNMAGYVALVNNFFGVNTQVFSSGKGKDFEGDIPNRFCCAYATQFIFFAFNGGGDRSK